ncbi:MAG: hypothetical protein K6A63_05195 [Acholeplasmatales bacterium]|nr:hypothetical protein [Acholeplasmatales bacterium]
MTLKEIIYALNGEYKKYGNKNDFGTLNKAIDLVITGFADDENLKKAIVDYIEEQENIKNVARNFVPGKRIKQKSVDDLKKMDACELLKYANDRHFPTTKFMLDKLTYLVNNGIIPNNENNTYESVNILYIKHRCHETDYGNNIDNIEQYLRQMKGSEARNLTNATIDKFVKNVRSNYSYSNAELDEARKDNYLFEYNNIYDKTMGEYNKQNYAGMGDSPVPFVLSNEAVNKFLNFYKIGEMAVSDIDYGDKLAMTKIEEEKESIAKMYNDIINTDPEKLEEKLKALNTKLENKKYFDPAIELLQKECKDDILVEPIVINDYPLKYVKNLRGVNKLNGLYCVNKIIKKLNIPAIEFIKNPIESLRRYEQMTASTFVNDKYALSDIEGLLPSDADDSLYRDYIYDGAVNFLATLDQKNAENNMYALSVESTKKRLRDENAIYKLENKVVGSGIDNIYDIIADEDNKINDIKVDNVNINEAHLDFYKNLLVAERDVTKREIAVGKYYDEKDGKIKENKEHYYRKVVRKIMNEVEKFEADNNYRVDKNLEALPYVLGRNFEMIKEAIYKKYNVKNILMIRSDKRTPSQNKNIAIAMRELRNLTISAIEVGKDVKLLYSQVPNLDIAFSNNKVMNDLTNDYLIYLNDHEKELINNLSIKDTRLNYAKTLPKTLNELYHSYEDKERKLITHFTDTISILQNQLLTLANERVEFESDPELLGKPEILEQMREGYRIVVAQVRDLLQRTIDEEIERLGKAYSNGDVPESYVIAQVRQIRLGEPASEVQFRLTPEEARKFAKEKYLIFNGYLPKPDGAALIARENAKDLHEVNYDWSKYKLVLHENKYNVENINMAVALASLDEARKNIIREEEYDPKNYADDKETVSYKKNAILLGYFANTYGAELEAKINALPNPASKTYFLNELMERRNRALILAVNRKRTLKGLPALSSKTTNYDALVHEAENQNINVNDIKNSVGFDYTMRFQSMHVDGAIAFFRSNEDIKKLDVPINNFEGFDYDNSLVFDYKNEFNNIIEKAKDKKYITFLIKNPNNNGVFDKFFTNFVSASNHTLRLQKGNVSVIKERFNNEFTLRENKNERYQADSRAELKDVIDVESPAFNENYNRVTLVGIDAHDLNGLKKLYDLSKFSLKDYATKKKMLATKMQQLSYLMNNKNTDPNVVMQRMEEINNLNDEIAEIEEKMTEFDKVASDYDINPDMLYPIVVEDTVDAFGLFQFMKNPTNASYLEGLHSFDSIVREQGYNPEDFFKPNNSNLFKELFDKMADRIIKNNKIRENCPLNEIFPLLMNDKAPKIENTKPYKDLMRLIDFLSCFKRLGSLNVVEAGEMIKSKVKGLTSGYVKGTNVLQQDGTKTYYNLLTAAPNDDCTKLIYNHQKYNNGASMYENVDGEARILLGNHSNPSLARLEANFNTLKASMKTFIQETGSAQAINELAKLTKVYVTAVKDYFVAHPDQLSVADNRRFKDMLKATGRFVDDTFAGININNQKRTEIKDSVKKASDVKEFDVKFKNTLSMLEIENSFAHANLEMQATKKNASQEERNKYIQMVNEEKIRLFSKVKSGSIPKAYYNEMLGKLNNSLGNDFRYIDRSFTEAEKNEMRRNLYVKNHGKKFDIVAQAPELEATGDNALNIVNNEKIEYINNPLLNNVRENINININMAAEVNALDIEDGEEIQENKIIEDKQKISVEVEDQKKNEKLSEIVKQIDNKLALNEEINAKDILIKK